MNPTSYGYIRVSTKEQHEDRQLIALREFPVREDRIYMDKLSGKNFDRPQYRKLIRRLSPGDVLVIKAIDRLGRNYDDIQEQWRIITKEIRADILIVDMPLLDTRAKDKNLTGTFIADLVLQILAYVAQSERENIRQRQAEGIKAAKERGVRFGRAPVEMSDAFGFYRSQWEKGEISTRSAARAGNDRIRIEPVSWAEGVTAKIEDLIFRVFEKRGCLKSRI